MHVHRGRGVDSGGERRRRPQHMCSLTIQKMAVIGSRRVFFRPTARPSCRHPGTRPSRSGTWNWARARRRWKATGTFVSFPRSGGERRRRPVHNVINVVTNLHPKYSSQVNGVSFSADGSLVASCSGDYRGDFSVRMWSVETGQELKKFLGHRCVVSGCCSPFSASQRRSCCSRASCR